MVDAKKTSIGGKSCCHLLNIKNPDQVKKRLKRCFQRVDGTLNSLKTGRTLQATMSLMDISETGSSFFVNELISKGSSVELCLIEPSILRIRGIIAWCVPVATGMDVVRNHFRAGMQFIYANDMQRTAVLDYCQKILVDPVEEMRTKEGETTAATSSSEVAAPGTEAAPVLESAPVVEASPVIEPDAIPVVEEAAAPTEAPPITEEPKAA